MKSLAVLAAAGALLVSATWGSAASASHAPRAARLSGKQMVLGQAPLRKLSALNVFLLRGGWITSHASGSEGAQAGPTTTPTTVSQFPDPSPILDKRDQVLGAVQRAHFNQVSTVENPQVEKAILTQVGDASCHGPKLRENVKAVDTLEATGASTTFKKQYIRIKNKVWVRSDAKHKWAATKLTKNTKIGLVSDVVSNPLPCGATAAAFIRDSSTAQSVTLKDLVNLGPATLGSVSVWHLHGTLVASTGETAEVDYFVSQDHFLPLKTVIITTTSDGYNLVLTVSLSKFDVKLNITAPKTK